LNALEIIGAITLILLTGLVLLVLLGVVDVEVEYGPDDE
jgi:hypothetical protein